ncbi:hypothetical protein QUF91_16120 [Lysinibacillus sp. G4S2]|nr:hypothetical protein [Lysinibacillus sp. G4S2]MDM5248809.1 hypothetical protein [Lysinibacillus sp. G4S2]
MDTVKRAPISIFNVESNTAELKTSMRDIASLAGVLNELGSQQIYESPLEILRFLNTIQLLYEESLGLTDVIEDTEMLYYRYRNTYIDDAPPTIKQLDHLIYILARNSWLTKQTRQIKLLDRGKRMMDALIRLANDSLAYYLQDDIGRSLFQARRDAELSAAYDDNGISGGNKIASMIHNVEDAIQKLELRQLEFFADRNALPQLEIIHQLMQELEIKMQERLSQFQTVEESLVMSELVQRGTAVLSKGTALSLGMLTKYIRFVTMQDTPLSDSISPEKVRTFIVNMYNPPIDSNIPNAYDLFSFMEQAQYKDEELDGIWLPIKFAAPIGGQDIDETIHYLETYEPKVNDPIEAEEEIDFEETVVEGESVQQLFDDAAWQMTKAVINTDVIEHYLDVHGESELEEVMIESSSAEWADSIRSLLAVSALTSKQKVNMKEVSDTKQFDKRWEWVEDDDRRFTLQRYKRTTRDNE